MNRFILFFALLLAFESWGQDRSAAKLVVRKLDGQPERRLALIIGNKDYPSSPLKNPLNDADDMTAALRAVGFDVMTYKNLDRTSLEEAIDKFSVALKGYEVGVFYYSGHGIQALGETYLVPTDVRELDAEARVKSKCVKLEYVLTALEGAATKTSLVFLDACRNNPFKKGWNRSFDKQGLSIPAYNPAGSIIVYATDAGSTADDNPTDRNGLFTKNLLKHLSTPNLTLNSILNRTRNDVLKTNPNQYPKEYGGLLGDFYFLTQANTDSQDLLNERKRREELEKKVEELEKKNFLPTPPDLKRRGAKFLDLPFSEMVYVEGGTFEMGDTRNEGESNEKPVHNVTVSSFLMGKYEVTQRQWTDIMGSNPSYFKNCDDCPVENVSWDDIREFLKRLNLRTGGNYRLPTEAEWEYAAGGGSTNRTRFGNGKSTISSTEANFDASAAYKKGYSEVGEYRGKTMRVGSFLPNVLGLHDLSGNVWEWCSDWYGSYPNTSQTNPTGVATGTYRVLRGGSWSITPINARVANRSNNAPDFRGDTYGFRLVSQAP